MCQCFLVVCSIIFILLGGITCSEDPRLIFPDQSQEAVIHWSVAQKGVAAAAYLKDADIVDSAVIDPLTGKFFFSDVAFGRYELLIKSSDFAPYREVINVFQTVVIFTQSIVLSKLPRQIKMVLPADSASVDSSYCKSDTAVTLRIEFHPRMDTASVRNALSISPALQHCITAGHYDVKIDIPADEFYSHARIDVALSQEASDIYFNPIDTALFLTYFPDTSYRARAAFKRLVKNIDIPLSSSSNLFSPADSITLFFRYPMDTASVGQALALSPEAGVVITWKGTDTARINFDPPLQWNTSYAMTFDTAMTTTDTQVVSRKVTFTFKTEPMHLQSTTITSIPMSITAPFVFSTNFVIDTASFRQAFSISPSVSFCHFIFNKQSAVLYHPPLHPDTTYTITISTALKDLSGSMLDAPFQISFQTDSGTTDDSSSYMIQTDPPDTAAVISLRRSVRIIFPFAVHKELITSHLDLSPSYLYSSTWYDTAITVNNVLFAGMVLAVTPNQYLQSNTVYSGVLDTVFLPNGNPVDYGFTFSYKTERPRLCATIPLSGAVSVAAHAAVQLHFNTIIDSTGLLQHITVSPAADSLWLEQATLQDSSITIGHTPFTAGTSYKITVDSTIQDIFGNTLAKPYHFFFLTKE